MYAQARSCPSLSPDHAAPSPGRLLVLTLGFIAAAVVAYSLVPLLPAARYVLSPAPPLPLPDSLSPLAGLLPDVVLTNVLRILGYLRCSLPELLLWGLAAMSFCPLLPMVLGIWRGCCFGAVLAMVTADSPGQATLTGVTPFALVWPMLCTAVLFWFAAVPMEKKQPWGGFVRRFLVCSGGVFALVLAGAMLPWTG